MTDDNIDSNNNQEQKLGYVYRHIRLDTNEVFYIGKGTNTDGTYKRSTCKNKRNKFWKRIVKKHDYRVEILIENLTEIEAFEKEIYYISHHGRRDLGTGTLVNMTAGGEGTIGYKHTEKTKEKMRSRTHLEETKEKMRSRTHTSETKNKLREASKGNTHNLGIKRTPEQIEKRYKPVGQYKGGILIKLYPSCKSVELDGYCKTGVGLCCRGKQKHHKGFEWKYL